MSTAEVTIDGYPKAGRLSVTIGDVALFEKCGCVDWKTRFKGVSSVVANLITDGAEIMITCAADKAAEIIAAIQSHFKRLRASCNVVCQTQSA